MNDQHRANLRKLADYLDTLPLDYSHFNMAAFVTHLGECDFDPHAAIRAGDDYLHNCGTVACAVGHAPAAGLPTIDSDWHKNFTGDYSVDWLKYTYRVFGIQEYDGGEEFDYMFGARWRYHDNTPFGAAARIRRFLDKGLPEEWDFNDSTYQEYVRAHA